MACCGDREKERKNQIPNVSGELAIFNGVGPDQTIRLNEQEIWMVRTSLKETLKRALNEHGYVNGEAKALLISLVEKIEPKPELPKGHCGCAHGEDQSGNSGSHIHEDKANDAQEEADYLAVINGFSREQLLEECTRWRKSFYKNVKKT